MVDPPFRRRDIHRPQQPANRKKVVARRPAMPRLLWWPCAIALFSVGALLTWAFAGDDDAGVWRILAGGGGVAVVGMVIVEAVWERRSRSRSRRRAGED